MNRELFCQGRWDRRADDGGHGNDVVRLGGYGVVYHGARHGNLHGDSVVRLVLNVDHVDRDDNPLDQKVDHDVLDDGDSSRYAYHFWSDDPTRDHHDVHVYRDGRAENVYRIEYGY